MFPRTRTVILHHIYREFDINDKIGLPLSDQRKGRREITRVYASKRDVLLSSLGVNTIKQKYDETLENDGLRTNLYL